MGIEATLTEGKVLLLCSAEGRQSGSNPVRYSFISRREVMPCRDDYADNQDRTELFGKVQILTHLLCCQCRVLEQAEKIGLHYMTNDVKSWWNKHKIQDEERRRREEFEYQEQRNKKLKEYEKLKKELGL